MSVVVDWRRLLAQRLGVLVVRRRRFNVLEYVQARLWYLAQTRIKLSAQVGLTGEFCLDMLKIHSFIYLIYYFYLWHHLAYLCCVKPQSTNLINFITSIWLHFLRATTVTTGNRDYVLCIDKLNFAGLTASFLRIFCSC